MASPGRPAAAGPPQALDERGIMGLIPQRGPMLLLESIPWLEAGVRAVARARDLSGLAPAIPRDPGEIPPELFVEGIAQTAAAVLVAEGVAAKRFAVGGPQPGVLAAIPDLRFVGPATGGGPVSFRAEVARRVGRIVIFRGEAMCGAALVAEGTLSIALGKPGG